MAIKNAKNKAPKVLSDECSVKANALIHNKLTSPAGDYKVFNKVLIFNSSNSVEMKTDDFVELAGLLEEDGRAGLLIQEHKEANPKYNQTAKPAIGAIGTLLDNKTITLDIKESMPGRALDGKNPDTRYMLVIEEDIFFKYYDVLRNDIDVQKYIDAQKKARRVLELND